MLTELGHYSLVIAFICIIFQGIYLIIKKEINREILLSFSKAYFLFITVSIFLLCYGYIVSDFSIINIVYHSHSSQPLLYKICGLWGNHEGSMLLWCWIISFYFFCFVLTSESFKIDMLKEIIKIQCLLNAFFVSFTLFTSNPFISLLFFYSDGLELNPILQDPGLAIHPPLLYFGYLGYSLIFSLLIGSLKFNNSYYYFKIHLKKWSLISWCFLTFGILLGSWWAYYELGWGGWWFWDPVENMSLMPWLLGTGLIHSIIRLNNEKSFSKWTVFLGIFSFLHSLIGTFFVRSGLLNSVHTFANDSTRGFFILSFFILIILISLFAYFNKKITIISDNHLKIISKEYSLSINNLLLVCISFGVFIGTFSPIIFKLFLNRDISIGSPFFNNVLVPLIFPFMLIMIISPFLNWNKSKNIKINISPVYLSFYCGFIIFLIIYFFNYVILYGIVFYLLMIMSLMLMVSTIIYSIKNKQINGTIISHLGFSLAVLSMCISSYTNFESIQLMKPGDQILLGQHKYLLRSINQVKGVNYHSLYADIIITNKENIPVTILFPEKRFYYIKGIFSTKSAIHSNLMMDLYGIVGDGNLKSGWYTRFYYNPMMPYMWVSGILIISGGIISLIKSENIKVLKDKVLWF